MHTLHQHLLDTPATASCLQAVDLDGNYLELFTGKYGISVTPELDMNCKIIPDLYSAVTFRVINGVRELGHYVHILNEYWFTEQSPQGIVRIFQELIALDK